jgi:hypothetical protein
MLCKNCRKELEWVDTVINRYPKTLNLLPDVFPAHWQHVDTGSNICGLRAEPLIEESVSVNES